MPPPHASVATLTALPTPTRPFLPRRERQLTELINRVPGARPLNGEASLLEAPGVTADGVPFSLRV